MPSVTRDARRPAVEPVVHSVTSAPPALADDQDERMRSYVIAMSVRTLSFIAGVLTITMTSWDALGWLFMALSVVLPYVAVVLANAVSRTRLQEKGPVPSPYRELGR